MQKDSSLYAKVNGVFVPRWLQSCVEIDAGAKLAYAWMSQLVDEDDSVLVCLEGLATALGVAEFQVVSFILQLREYGFIIIEGTVTGKHHFCCALCEPTEIQANLPSRQGNGFGRRRQTLTHSASSGNAAGENVNGGSGDCLSSRPLSRYDFETCLAYVKRCKEEGEPIESVFALARYLHRTGAQDEMITLVIGLGGEENLGRVEPPDGLPFEPTPYHDSPAEIQDETDLDQ